MESANENQGLATSTAGLIVTKSESKFVETAKDIIKTTARLAGQYIMLCETARKAQIAPARIRALMEPLGYAASRISEVIAVVSAPDDKWEKIHAAKLGFKKALDVARGGEIEDVLAGEIGNTEAKGLIADAKGEAIEQEENSQTRQTKSVTERLKESAYRLAELCHGNQKSKWCCNVRELDYVVEVRKVTPGKKSKTPAQPTA